MIVVFRHFEKRSEMIGQYPFLNGSSSFVKTIWMLDPLRPHLKKKLARKLKLAIQRQW